jgi:magnesium-transporting ATPase (P-type)
MDWEVINGVTGFVSMFCSVLGLRYFSSEQSTTYTDDRKVLSLFKIMAFILTSSGWSLLCLCFFWIFQPFGRYVRDDEYLILYSAILVLPAILIFSIGLKSLFFRSN